VKISRRTSPSLLTAAALVAPSKRSGFLARLLFALHLPHPHRWQQLKWGGTEVSPTELDARICLICGRFQVYAYWAYRDADVSRFWNIRAVEGPPYQPVRPNG
jgi:hypothetical protein